MKKFIVILGILAAAAGAFYWHGRNTGAAPLNESGRDYKNATYTIEGQPVTLTNGVSETAAAPGSASKITTRYFGNEAKGDLNGDGIADIAFLITQTGGGSGTFYYAVAALQGSDGGYRGTNAILLGDRIAPQTTEIRDGQLIVNYADRKPGEPMTSSSSVGVSKTLSVAQGQLVAK
jgi:hypothetical protein